MGEYFINILNMSYKAGIVICFILIGRFILGVLKGPKKYAYFLWVIPFTRMVIPFSFESILSLLPKESKPIRTDIGHMGTPEIYIGNAFVDEALTKVFREQYLAIV